MASVELKAAEWEWAQRKLQSKARYQYGSLPEDVRKDLVQEALEELVPRYNPQAPRKKTGAKQPVTWAEWVAWHGPHALSDAYRRWKRNPCTQALPLKTQPGRTFSHSVGRDPQRIVEDRELRRAIRQAVDRLPEPQRQMVIAYYYDDDHEPSMAEVAEAWGLSEECVKVRLHRARERLRQDLRDWLD